MIKVLVTGATGFVGRALCHKLIADGYEVVGTSRSWDNRDAPIGLETVSTGDIAGTFDWETVLKGVDAVVHLAARVHVMYESAKDPLSEFRKVNVDATLKLAEAAVAQGVSRFVYVSSIKVNGEETLAKAFHPDDQPNPSDPYGISKAEAEQALLNLVEGSNMVLDIVRPPLVYGPEVGANFLRLMRLVDLGIPLPLGAFRNQRSLLYIENLVDLLIHCTSQSGNKGSILLPCDGDDLSTPELLKLIAYSMNKRLILVPVPATLMRILFSALGKQKEFHRLSSSLTLEHSHLGEKVAWFPKYSVAEGILSTVSWYRRTYLKAE